MGWIGGNEIFDPVAEKLVGLGVDDTVKYEVASVLIGSLLNRDWATAGESLGMFADDEVIRRAFKDHGIFVSCVAEHDTEPWQCEEEDAHEGDHRDYRGRTWSNE